MASTTIANIQEAFRYTENEEQLMMALNTESVTWNLIGNGGKSFTRIHGRGQNIESIIKQLPERISGITEGGSLPSAIPMDTEEAVFSTQAIVGVWETSWSAMLNSRRSKAAFKTAIAMHQQGIGVAITQEMSKELSGDGRGILAQLSAATNSTTQNALVGIPAVRIGMVLDCMDTDNDTKHADSVSVTAEDKVTPQFTVDGAPTSTAALDFWCREDTTDDSLNDALHLNGLLGVISASNPASVVGNYGGINRSTAGNEFWQSPVLANGGTNRALTSDLLLQAVHMRRRVGGQNTKSGMSNLAFLTNDAIERRYVELFDALRIADVGSGPFAGDVGAKSSTTDTGLSHFAFSGIPIHVDLFSEANTVFMLDLQTLSIGYVDHKVPKAIDEVFEGQVPSLRQTSNATYEKIWYWEGELICTSPRRSVRIDDVAES